MTEHFWFFQTLGEIHFARYLDATSYSQEPNHLKMVQSKSQFQTDKLNEAFPFSCNIQPSTTIKRMLVHGNTHNATRERLAFNRKRRNLISKRTRATITTRLFLTFYYFSRRNLQTPRTLKQKNTPKQALAMPQHNFCCSILSKNNYSARLSNPALTTVHSHLC